MAELKEATSTLEQYFNKRGTIASKPFQKALSKGPLDSEVEVKHGLVHKVGTGYTERQPLTKQKKIYKGPFQKLPSTSMPSVPTEKMEGIVPLIFHNKSISESSSDDFLQNLGLEGNELFTEVLDVSRSNMISKIEYAPSRMVMRVTFVNKGSVVLYDHVPASVFAELKFSYNPGGTPGKSVLGARFWDLMNQFERASLQPGGPYHPKKSNFVKSSVKYPYTTLEYGYTPGTRRGTTGMDFDKGEIVPMSAAQREENITKARHEAFRSGALQYEGTAKGAKQREKAAKLSELGEVRVPKNWLDRS